MSQKPKTQTKTAPVVASDTPAKTKTTTPATPNEQHHSSQSHTPGKKKTESANIPPESKENGKPSHTTKITAPNPEETPVEEPETTETKPNSNGEMKKPPLTAHKVFYSAAYKSIKQKHPDWDFYQINRETSKKWKSEDTKRGYEHKWANMMIEYYWSLANRKANEAEEKETDNTSIKETPTAPKTPKKKSSSADSEDKPVDPKKRKSREDPPKPDSKKHKSEKDDILVPETQEPDEEDGEN